ncbi:hypothetical protein [uncultured Shewanella sp.]|uniref:hypothetical protein n=1 Tax=uncultured Shewanella sp. TaxID=173975 RepID=UPI0026170D70|nr:hypothetical protein [uncultured Shewanella sp.]
MPTWQHVIEREYHEWQDNNRLVIDTAGKTIEQSQKELISVLELEHQGFVTA